MKTGRVPRRLLHDALLEHGADPARARRTAVVAEGREYSYGELLAAASRLAAGLRQRGVGRGDRVAIYMDNTWPCVVAIFATLLAGGVFLVVNPLTKSDKLGFILDDSGARVLLSDGHIAQEFTPLLAARPGLHVIASGRLPMGPAIEAFDAVLAAGEPLGEPPATIALDLAALIYTSGSTGQPKGVMQTHQSMLFAAGSLIQYLRLAASDRILCTLPLAFDYGLYQWLMAVQLGAVLVLERSFAFPAQVFARMLRPGLLPGERVLCTQDWFRMDAQGFLYFVGRTDDIIKTRGEKVSPVEVENVLHAIDGIREAAVVGVPDQLLGEAIRAYVVLEPGAALDVGRIRAQCMKRLESFMVPQQIVPCAELPRTATGKVSRKALLEHPPA